MPKRFTATEKWEDRWFRRLPLKYKLLWIYILDKCNVAGIWEYDLELAEIFIEAKFNEKDFIELFRGKYTKVSHSKLFIPKFLEFQYACKYNELNDSKPVHKRIIMELKKFSPDTLSIDYKQSIDTLQEEEEDKDKVKVKEKDVVKEEEKISYAEFVTMTLTEYSKLTEEHGEEMTKGLITILDNAKGAKGYKYKSDYRAINEYNKRQGNKSKQTGNQARQGSAPETFKGRTLNPDEY